MVIAANIFWIVIGLIYILYKLFKENPEETSAVVAIFVIILVAFIVYNFLLEVLMKQSIVLGVVFGIACIALLLYAFFRVRKKHK